MNKERIAQILTVQGALGVNALAAELGVPSSSLQRYLSAQSYFKKNESKKWDLPENVESENTIQTVRLMIENAKTSIAVISSQIEGLGLRVQSQTETLELILKSLDSVSIPKPLPPVASPLDARFQVILDGESRFKGAIKAHKTNVRDPEFYKLLMGFDLVSYTLKYGTDSADLFFEQDLAPVILGENSPSEETYSTLREHQK